MPSRARKVELFARTKELIESYSKILIVGCNNVGSSQMAIIRKALRGKAIVRVLPICCLSLFFRQENFD